MKTFCFVPINGTNDEIVIHASNLEAARVKLENYVLNIKEWKLC